MRVSFLSFRDLTKCANNLTIRVAPLLATLLLITGCSRGSDSTTQASPNLTASFPPIEATVTPPPPATMPPVITPTSVPIPPPDMLDSDARIRIPKIGVDAPLSMSIVGADGRLADMPTPDDVLLYDFKEFPGLGGFPGGGNTILAGKRDSGTQPCQNGTRPPPCPGAFFELTKLTLGDKIQLALGSSVHEYSVVSVCYKPRVSTSSYEYIYKTSSSYEMLTINSNDIRGNDRTVFYLLLIRAEKTPNTVPTACKEDELSPP